MRTDKRPSGRARPSFIEEARRAQIIEAATQTVAEVGYAHASLARIAERADISKSVISYHFDGKAELLEAVVGRFIDAVWAHMQARLETATSPTERIRVWVESQLSYFAGDRPGFMAMVEIVSNHRRDDGSRPFQGLEQQEIDALTAILEDGQRLGEFRAFDPRAVAQVIAQTMEGALSHWAYEGTLDLHPHIPIVVDYIEHAIRAEPS